MQFDPALAAQAAFQKAEAELGSNWGTAVEIGTHLFSQGHAVASSTNSFSCIL